jgi:hypothetical protein
MKASVLAIAAAGFLAGAALPARAGDSVYVDQVTGTPQQQSSNVAPSTSSLLGDVLAFQQQLQQSGDRIDISGLPPGATGDPALTFTVSGVQFPHAPAAGTVSYVIQNGDGNTANADLVSGNASGQFQFGDGNKSTVALSGYGNVAGTLQVGDGNTTALTMSGNDTTLVSAQFGNGLNLNYGVSQTGAPKTILITQHRR